MELLTDVLSWTFLVAGSSLAVIGGVGVIRMPDLFTRLHASGVTDTGGAGLILVGLMFQGGWSAVTLKLLLILGFLWFSSPVSTYALARAALAGGEEPFWAEDLDLPSTARIPGFPRQEEAGEKEAEGEKDKGREKEEDGEQEEESHRQPPSEPAGE